jgi:hypothetical protein
MADQRGRRLLNFDLEASEWRQRLLDAGLQLD